MYKEYLALICAIASPMEDLCSGTGPNGHFSNSPAGTFATLVSTDISNRSETSFLLHLAEYYIVSVCSVSMNVPCEAFYMLCLSRKNELFCLSFSNKGMQR